MCICGGMSKSSSIFQVTLVKKWNKFHKMYFDVNGRKNMFNFIKEMEGLKGNLLTL